MTEIKYKISQVYTEHDSIVIRSNTAWHGRLTFTKEQFNEVGRPTAGDTLILNVRLLPTKANSEVEK